MVLMNFFMRFSRLELLGGIAAAYAASPRDGRHLKVELIQRPLVYAEMQGAWRMALESLT